MEQICWYFSRGEEIELQKTKPNKTRPNKAKPQKALVGRKAEN